MNNLIEKKCICKLCGFEYATSEMSEEHYPARSTGNEDIVKVDIIKMIDTLRSGEIRTEVVKRIGNGEKMDDIAGNIFDTKISTSLHPDGRTSRTLCKKCNTFLGKYDEAYLRFFNVDGNPKVVKGFQPITKIQIIKAIYAKFLSIPESVNEEFDFLEFIRDKKSTVYEGNWRVYFIKRNNTTDLFGMKDIETGRITFDVGVVYQMSDEKFIYYMMNFPKHSCYNMTNIFDILQKQYTITVGVGENGGYHAQFLIARLLSENDCTLN